MYRLEIKPSAEKDVRRLPLPIARRILEAISGLHQSPRPPGSEKLKVEEAYRIRVGSYRIIYHVNDAERVVTVLRVKHRREAYR